MSRNDTITKINKQRKSTVKRVALLLESDMAFDRGIARGIGDYIRSQSGWVILMDPMTEADMAAVKHWKPDGIITSIHLPDIENIAGIADIPMVGFGSYSKSSDGHLTIPIVTSDQPAIGAMAARHFLNHGLRNFAFCGGTEKKPWSTQRGQGFAEELEKHAYECHFYEQAPSAASDMPNAVRSLVKWLKSLPQPCGVFVFFDGWARWILDACVIAGISVPQEISVLGVDNDRWLCELSQPMLSSIDANVRTAGHTAAELLDTIMKGETAPPPLTFIKPLQVIARDSSSYLNFEDPEVAFALRYIKEHACDPITTADVLKVTGMSNSTAYRKFMKAIGRSIHNEIQRIQMDRIKNLLVTTNLNVSAIAQRAGFDNVRYLTQVFKDLTSQTPTEYRRTQSTPEVG